jgi:hypothetical protein
VFGRARVSAASDPGTLSDTRGHCRSLIASVRPTSSPLFRDSNAGEAHDIKPARKG